jgi:hypothetical protein
LTIKLADDTIKSLAIYNILGQTMIMSMETANKQANLNVASLARTIYFKITTTNGDQNVSLKLVLNTSYIKLERDVIPALISILYLQIF